MKSLRKRIAYATLLAVGVISLPAVLSQVVVTDIEYSMSSYVLIGMAAFLAATDLASERVAGSLYVVVRSLRKLGGWTLVGLFINSLTVAMGLLALRWGASPPLTPIQSILHPAFEILGSNGSLIFAAFAAIGLIATIRLVFVLTRWTPVKQDDAFIGGTGYKRQLISALVLAAFAIPLVMLGDSGGPITFTFKFLAPFIAVGAFAHISGVLVRVFGRHPWRETAAELLWGSGLVVVVYFGLTGAYEGYLLVADQYINADAQVSISPYIEMIMGIVAWIGAFMVVDTLTGVLSIHMYNTRRKWFTDSVGSDPKIVRKLLHSGGTMAIITFVLVDQSGPLALMTDLDFGGLSYAAYAMIAAIIVSRVIELFAPPRVGVLASSTVAWAGIAYFSAALLANLPAVIETLDKIPNLANFAVTAQPYALAVANASWWLIAGIAIVGFGKTVRSLDIVTGQAGAPTLLAAIGFVAVGWMSWAVADAFSTFGPGFRLAGAVVLGATFGGSLSLLATFFAEGTTALIAHPASWFASSRFRAMNIGGFTAAYILVLRTAIFDVFAYAPLIEWIAVALISTYIARRTWVLGKDMGQPGNVETPAADWVSHDQTVDFVEEAALSKLMGEYSAFLENDHRSTLVTRLSTVMWESGRPYDDILGVVSQLLGKRSTGDLRDLKSFWRIPFRGSSAASASHQEARRGAFKSIGEVLETPFERSGAGSIRTADHLKNLITECEQTFVDTSDQSQLVTTCCVTIWSDGADRAFIARVLEPLARYTEPLAPWYRIGPLKRSWDAATRENRIRTVENLRQAMAVGGLA